MSTPAPEPGRAEGLRTAVLRAWCESPTRFTEDANAEEDLRRGGYRDRLFVELAQNAADAAAQQGVPGRLRVSIVDGQLRAANTGRPLDDQGVAALASLRASAKRAGTVTVGRFGVGFAAVLAVSDAPVVVSTGASVAFSASRTRAAVAAAPELREQLAARAEDVPVLRLPWPVPDEENVVPQGFDTEVRLPLRPGVDAGELVTGIAESVPDVLLALPWLASVEVGEDVWRRDSRDNVVTLTGPDGAVARWLTHAVSGEFDEEAMGSLGVEAAARPRWHCLWAVPVDADRAPLPLSPEVLHVPTPTDERLSLPARLIATVPVEPSRRRVAAGAATAAVLAGAAAAYPGLVAEIPDARRLELIPGAGFPLSEVDATLRERIGSALERAAWLPAVESPGQVTGSAARVLALDAPELIPVLAGIVPGLVAGPLCGPAAARALGRVGAVPLEAAELVDAVTGIDRPAAWWHRLYSALWPLVDTRAVAANELGALPVPLRDGRTLPGPGGALLTEGTAELADLLAGADVVGLRLVHPAAAHPLLERLSARRAGPAELLDSPAVADAVERSVHDALSGMDTRPLADAVLRLVAEVGGRAWAGALALPARDGGRRRASELVHPGGALLGVLDPEVLGGQAPLNVLDGAFAERWPADVLAGVGVLDGFSVLADEEPTGPEHDLPDELDWWESAVEPPRRVLAVRELDLVADECWPDALRLLATRPETWRALVEPGGHAGWWIARYALLDGHAPTDLRLPEATGLAGLYDPAPEVGLPVELLRAAGVRADLAVADADDVADLLERLGDPRREIGPGLVARVHAALVESGVDSDRVSPPARVRSLDGAVLDAERAAVLDEPWLIALWSPGSLVAGGTATGLADLLDLPLAGELTTAEVDSDGEYVPWSELGAVVLIAELLGFELPAGGLLVHDPLTVRVDDATRPVPWWASDRLHATDSAAGLGRALAWACGRWPQRHLIIALLDEPEPATLLA